MLPIEENYFDSIRIDENYNVFAIDKVNKYQNCLPEEISISSGLTNDLKGNGEVTINLLDSGRSIKYREIFPSLKDANIYAKELNDLITTASNLKNAKNF